MYAQYALRRQQGFDFLNVILYSFKQLKESPRLILHATWPRSPAGYNIIIIFVFATHQILQSYYCPTYAFLCKYIDSMLILCNIFAKLEHLILFKIIRHLILFKNVDKHHNFIYYRINIR